MNIKEQLIKHEGLKLNPYKCTSGKLTIGVGRNIEENGISEDEAHFMLVNDINKSISELQSIFSKYKFFSENRKKALIDMIFNLGKTRFLKFKKMIKAIKEDDWNEASKEAKDSRWYKQVKSRGGFICEQLKKE